MLTDSDDTEMFDNSEEDKDLVSQVSKGSSQEGSSEGTSEEKAGGSESAVKAEEPKTTEPQGESAPAAASDAPKASEDKKTTGGDTDVDMKKAD